MRQSSSGGGDSDLHLLYIALPPRYDTATALAGATKPTAVPPIATDCASAYQDPVHKQAGRSEFVSQSLLALVISC